MQNIKHHRLASVNREEESKELWAVARRNPAFKDLHALYEKVFYSPATLALLNACSVLANCSCSRTGHAWATNCWVSWWW